MKHQEQPPGKNQSRTVQRRGSIDADDFAFGVFASQGQGYVASPASQVHATWSAQLRQARDQPPLPTAI